MDFLKLFFTQLLNSFIYNYLLNIQFSLLSIVITKMIYLIEKLPKTGFKILYI